MSHEERAEARTLLRNLENKTRFLLNPRQSKSASIEYITFRLFQSQFINLSILDGACF